jgi:hypothetical protein
MELGLASFLTPLVAVVPKRGVILHWLAHPCGEDDGDLVGRRGRGRRRSQFGFQAAQLVPQRRLVALQRMGRSSEPCSGPVLCSAAAPPQPSSCADVVIGAQPQPRHKMSRRGPSRPVPPPLAEQHENQHHQSRNRPQIHAEKPVRLGSPVEVRVAALLPAPPLLRLPILRPGPFFGVHVRFKGRHQPFDLLVTIVALVARAPLQRQSLLERPPRFTSPVALPCFSDGLFTRLDARMAQPGQHGWLALPGHDSLQNRPPR